MIEAAAIGVAAGLVAGMLGVGGGILFVPALVLVLGLSQIHAEATSLLAIIPVCLLGAWRQRTYGNVRLADGITIGVLSALGAFGGVAAANSLSGRTLRVAFAILLLATAAHLARRALRTDSGEPGERA